MPLRPKPDHIIYEEEMIKRCFGFPQWSADPYESPSLRNSDGTCEIRIGDVGYFKFGKFTRILSAEDSPIATDPNSIEKCWIDMPGLVYSNSVHKISVETGATGPSAINPAGIGGGASFSVTCSSEQGAILHVQDGGSTFSYCNDIAEAKLKEYFLDNYRSWLTTFKGVESHRLVLVTGLIQSRNWEVAAFRVRMNHMLWRSEALRKFHQRETESYLGELSINVLELADGKVSIDWTPTINSRDVGYGTGHRHQRPLSSIGDQTVSPTSTRMSFGRCCTVCHDAPENQTIFLRGFHIREIEFLGVKIAQRIDVKESKGSTAKQLLKEFLSGRKVVPSLHSTLQPSSSDHVVGRIEGDYDGASNSDLYDEVALRSLELQYAEAIIIHDDDVIRMLGGDPKRYIHHRGSDMEGVMESRRPDRNEVKPDKKMVLVAPDNSSIRKSDSVTDRAALPQSKSRTRRSDDEASLVTRKKPRDLVATARTMPKEKGPPGPATKQGGQNIRACNTCRSRKGKCDGNGVDKCSWCRAKNQDCSYNPGDRRLSTWNKQARESHRSLGKQLMTENEALGAEIEILKQRIVQMGAPPYETNFAAGPSHASASIAFEQQPRRLFEWFDRDKGGKPLAMHGEWSPWISSSFTSSSNPPQLPLQSPTAPASRDIDYKTAIHANVIWRRCLPTQGLIDAFEHQNVLDLYFKFNSSWGFRCVPLLFWRDMYNALQLQQPARTAHWSPFLHNAVVTLALGLSDKPQMRSRQNRDYFAQNAKNMIEAECEQPSISTVTAFSCLACYHSGMGEHTLAFMYYGLSVQMCRSMSLDVDCADWVNSGQISPEEQVDRYWSFWSTFSSDVWLSLYVGREFSINLSHVSVPLPQLDTIPKDNTAWLMPGTDDGPRPNLWAETFIESCKLTVIATKIMDVVYGTGRQGSATGRNILVQRIDAELNDWHSALPEVLSNTALPHTLMMHIAYWFCHILLHRPTYKANRTPQSTSRKLCLRASRIIIDYALQWKEHYGLHRVPLSMLRIIYTVGTTWLLAVTEPSHKRLTSEGYLSSAEQCVSFLRETLPTWESGPMLANALSILVREQRDHVEALEISGIGVPESSSLSPMSSEEDAMMAVYWHPSQSQSQSQPNPHLSMPGAAPSTANPGRLARHL